MQPQQVLSSFIAIGLPHHCLMRQTVNSSGRWKQLSFNTTSDARIASNFLFAVSQGFSTCHTYIPRNRRIILLTEPPEVKVYPLAYIKQFGTVVSPMPQPNGYNGRFIRTSPALPWHYGLDFSTSGGPQVNLDWAQLEHGPKHPKIRQLSVICSTKTKTRQQRQRLDFVAYLQDKLGDQVNVFGRGHREVSDKAEAIAPYRYHIVLENNVMEHFWTEKLADSYLGGAFPFYAGAPGLSRYFPKESFMPIDIREPAKALHIIRTEMCASRYEVSSRALAEAKRRVMHDHNLFSVLERAANVAHPEMQPGALLEKPAMLFPINHFRSSNFWANQVLRRAYRLGWLNSESV